mgnify:CR=1 FL=1
MKNDIKGITYKVIDWSLHFISYATILVLVATFFDSFKIDDNHLYLYGILATLIIFILNKTVKPIIFKLTLPITGLTLGLFYPFINVIILKLTEWILGPHFEIEGIWTVFFLAILISVINIIIENVIITPIMRRIKKNG